MKREKELEKAAAEARACLAFALRRATRTVDQVYDRALRPHGLRITQLNLLVALYATRSTSIGALAKALSVDRTTLTRNLGVLQTRGYVKIAPGPDRRTRAVSLTDAGEEALAAALPSWQEAHSELIAQLDDDGAVLRDAAKRAERAARDVLAASPGPDKQM